MVLLLETIVNAPAPAPASLIVLATVKFPALLLLKVAPAVPIVITRLAFMLKAVFSWSVPPLMAMVPVVTPRLLSATTIRLPARMLIGPAKATFAPERDRAD